jgi:hypothetical protein
MGNLEIFGVLVCPCLDEEMVEGEGEANCGEQEGRRRVVGFVRSVVLVKGEEDGWELVVTREVMGAWQAGQFMVD